jgi:PST family polysaccharide transporter
MVALSFVINSLSTVQRARLQRAMDFRLLTLVELFSAGLAGALAVVVALMGGGVWSLIYQTLAYSSLAALAFWLASGWRPRLVFNRHALGELLWFGGNLLGFSVVNYWIRNIDKMLIGKVLGSEKLGVYTRAYNLMLLPLTQITSVLTSVMFPALSRIQEDRARVKRVFLRAVGAISLVTFPMMLGALATADHLVLAVYGPQWSSAVPVFKILCLLGMVQSIASPTGWIFQSQGRTDWFFWWGAGAGALLIGSIAVGIWIGTIEAVAVCYALMSGVILLYPSIAIPGKLIGMRFGEVVSAVTRTSGCSVAMAAVVWCVGLALPVGWPHWAFLLLQVPTGIAVYCLLIHGLSLPSYLDVRQIAVERLGHSLPLLIRVRPK